MSSNKKFIPLSECYDKVLSGNSLNEKTNITVRSGQDEPVNFSLSDHYYNKVLKPVLSRSTDEEVLAAFLQRGKEAGVSDDNDEIDQPEIVGFFNYTKECTNVNNVAAIFKDKQKLHTIGQTFLNKIAAPEPGKEKFNFISLLDTLYGGKFTYNSYLIDIVKPAMARGATQGAPGPGEAFLAFFYNGTKPDVGDLVINNVACELKKQGGRIGKGIDVNDGVEYKRLYPDRSNSSIDVNTLKDVITKYNLTTIKDLLLGKGQWSGISGVRSTFTGDFLNEDVNSITRFKRDDIGQIIGTMQLIDYTTKVKKFKYIIIFDETGNTIGYDVDKLGTNPEQAARTLNSLGIFFKFKSGGGSMFDKSGMMINFK